jgi:ATP-dependent helicase/DNAse subunit B
MDELEKIKRDRLKLQGYSIDDTEILERFDSTFIDSEYIKSMKYSDEKGFGTYSKVINAETVDNMIEFTKDKIDEVSNNILDSKFDINPKFYDKENISCKFCSFQDICYMRDSNLRYLSKVENLDFLGGEE